MSVRILVGDVRAKLAEIEPNSIDCVMTSPPYWGLRDYGVDGQIGLERTLGEHIEVMVEVFGMLPRILKPWATVWLNYGDCFATEPAGRSAADTAAAGNDDRTFRDKPFSTIGPIYDPGYATPRGVFEGTEINASGLGPKRIDHGGRIISGGILKPKDLCMIPNRLAIALQEAGWWVRAEIIWGKPNPMPDSRGAQRPSTAHEKIFLLGHNDQTCCWRHADGRWTFKKPAPDYAWKNRSTGAVVAYDTYSRAHGPWFRINRWAARDQYYEHDKVALPVTGNSHARTSQDVTAQAGSTRANGGTRAERPMKAVTRKAETAFAAGPPRSRPHTGLTSADQKRRVGRGVRMDASLVDDPSARATRFLRNYEPASLPVWQIPTAGFSEAHFATFPPELAERCIIAGCPVGGTVLDPFGGAGTVGLVADALGDNAVLIELNPDYAAIAARRLKAGLVRVDGGDSRRGLEPLPLDF